MRVELTTEIAISDIDLGLIDEADDLDVVGRAHELDALEGTLWDDASNASGLGTPRDLLALRVRNQ